MFRRVDSCLSPQNPEDKSWQRKVLGMAGLDEYSEEDFIGNEELELVLRIFGLYQKQELPKFHSHYFVPQHGNFENTE